LLKPNASCRVKRCSTHQLADEAVYKYLERSADNRAETLTGIDREDTSNAQRGTTPEHPD
jgi:hypothetical protein